MCLLTKRRWVRLNERRSFEARTLLPDRKALCCASPPGLASNRVSTQTPVSFALLCCVEVEASAAGGSIFGPRAQFQRGSPDSDCGEDASRIPACSARTWLATTRLNRRMVVGE